MATETVAQGLRDLLENQLDKVNSKGQTNGQKGESKVPVTKFLPGRTCYVYDLDEDFGLGIPTTVSRSKTEYSHFKYQYVRGGAMDDSSVLDRIAGVLGYVTQGRKGKSSDKRHKRKQKGGSDGLAGSGGPQTAGDAEDDIFADAGTDFEDGLSDSEEDRQQPQRQGGEASASGSKYFGEAVEPRATASGDAGRGDASGEGATYTYKDLEDEEDRDLADLREKKHGTLGEEGRWHEIMTLNKSGEQPDGGDAYGDLYPGYDSAMYDNGFDDEEEEGKKRDLQSLASEAGGTKKRKGEAKDAKLNTEYSKMKKLFKEKGFGNESAFAKEEKEAKPQKNKKKSKSKKGKEEEGRQANDDVTFHPRQKRLRL
ncbi:hypothetical protein HOP50_17g79640 [Chloropicon primus]|uniref:RED-like N-terminal domain-containing protein n=1 Tax=Chloropicon primus TaxID=1764295 RepID=A0A5B8MXX5_9CHLO|nr:hypothetical protein A3770_17p79410 [Chloropicon primus]UPR04620.1 hypothetical protein HOP50_17g79640 [Chloropicon primus]|mmetsp:Transcript_12697/g.35480  ORF Transcript_12697/g.35480 Transcript_12697/m.35480 type:complete len:369 (-) Transcript_12697:1075-2181(-)|eukprot:QDZ25423.1 hypothetical protein A3770_17p79410 [Chloropicon primus]